MNHRIIAPVFLLAICASSSPCQETSSESAKPVVDTAGAGKPHEGGRILGIIPNYRTFPSLKNYTPLKASEKFKIASEDAFDRGTLVMAAAFGGLGQLTNANRPFGQGVAGYSRYFGASYGDLVIGDYMTEAIFPHATAPGSALLPARLGKRVVESRLCREPDLPDSSEFRRHAIQLLGAAGKFRSSRNFERVLLG